MGFMYTFFSLHGSEFLFAEEERCLHRCESYRIYLARSVNKVIDDYGCAS